MAVEEGRRRCQLRQTGCAHSSCASLRRCPFASQSLRLAKLRLRHPGCDSVTTLERSLTTLCVGCRVSGRSQGGPLVSLDVVLRDAATYGVHGAQDILCPSFTLVGS